MADHSTAPACAPVVIDAEPMDIIREEARAVALSFGVRACDEAAAALIDRVHARLAGSHIYLAKRSAVDRRRRQAEMMARFDGTNLEPLAREYRISLRHARRLVMVRQAAVTLAGER